MTDVKVSTIREIAAEFQAYSDRQLAGIGESIRQNFAHGISPSTSESSYSAMALAVECVRRTLNISLYDTQIVAAGALVGGKIAEMETGEGKTYSAAPAAIALALQGQQVHIGTTNAYLAERDFELLKPAFELAGVSTALLPDQGAGTEAKSSAYQSEVVYGTGTEFGFDYLRDSLTNRKESRRPLGEALLERLTGRIQSSALKMQNSRHCCIIDEADNVLIDEACSPLILSSQNDEPASDSDACRLAAKVAASLEMEKHFQLTRQFQAILTDIGWQFIHSPSIAIPIEQLRRPWSEYIQQALQALFFFQQDSHYVIKDGKVQIVDSSTGRIFADRSWSDGLHQAVEAKENVTITNERVAMAQITRQKFYRIYQSLGGMTGTVTGCEAELREIYRTEVVKIPRRLPCCREIYSTRVFADAEKKWQEICNEVKQIHSCGRPILIGTRTISESEYIADLLCGSGLPYQILNGRQDGEEADLISRAGQTGAIMIATNLAGRGTDIKLTAESKAAGGLHVVVSAPQDLYRIDRQLIGRSARQGDPGSARTYLSADDEILSRHAPWLANSIRKEVQRTGEVCLDLTANIRNIQRSVERKQAIARSEMLKQDLARDKLLAGFA